jgi:PAS domain-containing protein
VDIAGNGLVRTNCYPVLGETPPEELIKDTRAPLIGSVCIDLSLPYSEEFIATLLKALRENPLIDASAYEIQTDPQGGVTRIPRTDLNSSQSEYATEWPEERLVALIKSTGCNSAGTPLSQQLTENPWTSVKTCELSPDEHFVLVPLYRTPKGSVIAVVIRPHPPVWPRGLIVSWVVGSGSLAGVLVCLFLLGGSRLRTERARQNARLRSLPVAMVDCDQDDRIVAANHRMEELVQGPLPKFGLARRKQNKRFDTFFENFVQARLGTPDGDPTGDVTDARAMPRWVTLDDELRKTRVAGHRSVYFASTRSLADKGPARKWVKIIASPEMSADDAERFREIADNRLAKWVPTFGILLEITHAEQVQLDTWLAEKASASPLPSAVQTPPIVETLAD